MNPMETEFDFKKEATEAATAGLERIREMFAEAAERIAKQADQLARNAEKSANLEAAKTIIKLTDELGELKSAGKPSEIRDAERDSIVAWLRRNLEPSLIGLATEVVRNIVAGAADSIESNQHRGAGEQR